MRKFHKTIDINEGLQKLEQIEQERFEKVQAMREQDFKTEQSMNEELDTAFYFSVVFNTRKERDAWLKEHDIQLVEDFFVKAENFNI